jgi:uncharacterized phage infection (PIP) family protein YhgE
MLSRRLNAEELTEESRTFDGVAMRRMIFKASLEKKLTMMFVGGFCAFLIFFLATMAISSSNQRKMTELVEIQLPIIEISGRLANSIDTVRSQVVQGALSQSMDGIGGLKLLHGTVQEEFKKLQDIDTEDRERLENLRVKYEETYKEASTLLDEVVAGLETLSKAQARFQKLSSNLSGIAQEVYSIKSNFEGGLKTSVETTKSSSRTAVLFGVLLIALAIPFAIVFFRMLRGINRELMAASRRLHEASDKILGISTAAQVSSGQLAANSAQQASSVQKSAANMEEMKQMLSQTARHSGNALTSSEASFQEAHGGKRVIDNMKEAMNAIERSYQELEAVNALVGEIRSKTAVINEIVFKTQILSFNASLEAARAGMHGRGFAVVAEEVGKLAVMSGSAADDIEKMLEHSANKIAETIHRTKQKVDAANSLSQQCGEVFDRITERTEQTKSMVGLISNAAVEQNSGIHSVGQAMVELNKGATETNSMAQSIAELSGSLRTESSALADTVLNLNRLVLGGEMMEAQAHLESEPGPEASDDDFDISAA